MRKGNYGICFCFYAVLAFVLAFLGQTLICALLLGFVIVAEKDEWAVRQVMQAFFLALCSSVVSGVLGIFGFLQNIPFVGGAVGTVFSFISGIVSLLILIFAIIALVRVVKEQDAALPGLSHLAERAFGMIQRRVPQYPQAPQYPVNGNPPQNPQA